MALIGMAEASKRTGMTVDGIRAALRAEKVPLVTVGARTLAVEEADLQAFIQRRGGRFGPGRPPKGQSEE